MPTISSLAIYGKRWFSRSKGNTYFSAYALINGQHVEGLRIDYAYGYGNHYEDCMFDLVESKGLLDVPRERYEATGARETAWRYCERLGIAYARGAVDVARKKDL
jgi:hypothetical protein